MEQITEDYKEEGEYLEQVVRQWLRTGVSWTQVVQLLSQIGDKLQASQFSIQKGQLHTHTHTYTHILARIHIQTRTHTHTHKDTHTHEGIQFVSGSVSVSGKIMSDHRTGCHGGCFFLIHCGSNVNASIWHITTAAVE